MVLPRGAGTVKCGVLVERCEALVGRDETLRDLRAVLGGTARGIGGCVMIEGPAGIGKTRMLEALAAEASTLDITVAVGRAAELDRATPLATMLGLLSRHASELLTGAFVETDASGLWRVNQLRSHIEEYVRDRRLMVMLDDAHWADELTAQALRLLVPALASSPVLWVLARRPGPVRGAVQTTQDALDWLIAEGARRVSLGPLDEAAVATLCEHVLGATPDHTVLRLAARSDGNPFLLCELLNTLRDSGQLRIHGDQVSVVGNDLPSDFLSAVHRRLRNLSDRVRQLLDAGAVLGRPFTVHEAAGLLGCRAVDLVTAVTDAVDCGMLVDDGDELAFRHELIREAFYNALSGPVRSALHREAATVTQDEGRSAVEVAEHLMLCGRPGNERAREVLAEAVAQVAPNGPGAAADLSLRMLELTDEHDAGRPLLIADTVRLLAAAGRIEQATELGERALRSGLDAASEGALVVGLSEALKHAGRNSAVVHYTGRALSRDGVPDPTRAQLLAIRAHGLLNEKDLSHADRAGMEAAEIGARIGEHAATVFALSARSIAARSRGALDEAVRYARDAVRTADLAGGEASHRHPRLWLGRALTEMDQFAEADAVYEMGQREADQLGTAWSKALLAEAAGEYHTALELLAEIYQEFPRRLLILTENPLAGAVLVRIAQRAGSHAQAEAAVSAMRLLAERNPRVPSLAAAIAHADGVLTGDLATLRRAVRAYQSSPRLLARAAALDDTARGEGKAGHRSVEVQLLREALQLYERCGARRNASRVIKRLSRLGIRRASARNDRSSVPWDTLSESELRVVRLVAEGLTNREVAYRLFLSPHTVDSHLRHSFTKLGINSRVELTRQVLIRDHNRD